MVTKKVAKLMNNKCHKLIIIHGRSYESLFPATAVFLIVAFFNNAFRTEISYCWMAASMMNSRIMGRK